MEDLAHFIQSMSEKYGLLDAANKDSREFVNLSGDKQIQECPSSAASNSCSNEDCSAQASSWEYLSIFIGGQSLDSKTSFGSRNLHPSPVLFHPGNDSHVHAYAKMININEEPELDSPLPAPSHIVIKEQENADFLAESDSMIEPGQIAPYEKDFSDIVTMSDYLQSVYCSEGGSKKLRLTDNEALSGTGELQEMTCKSGRTSSREDSTSSLEEDHKRTNEFYSRDLKECSHSGGSSSRSHHLEGEKASSARVEYSQGQDGANCTTSPTEDMHRQYGSWNSALADSQQNCEDTSTWRPMTPSSKVQSSVCASEQTRARTRRQSGVVSSFVGLDDEAELGDSVALHEFAVSSGGSSSRSCQTEGGEAARDGREEGYDDRSRARHQKIVGEETSSHRMCNFSSIPEDTEEEEESAEGYGSSSNNCGAQHIFCHPLEDEERRSGSSYGRSKKLAGTQKVGNSKVEEQVTEAGLGLSSGFGYQETKQKSGYSMPGDRELDTRGYHLHSRNHDFEEAQQEGHFWLRDQDRAVGSSHGRVNYFGGPDQDHVDYMQGLHETEQGKGSFHNRSRNLGGAEHIIDDSIQRVEEREGREASSDGRKIDLGGKRDGLKDIDSVRDQEQTISFQGRDNYPAGFNQDNSMKRAQEQQPGGDSSFGRSANFQGSREDFRDSLNKDHKKRIGGGSSNYSANTFEQCSVDSKSGKQESERQCVPKETRVGHSRNEENLVTSVRGEQESQRRGAQEKRAKNGEMQDSFDCLNDLLHRGKPGEIFSSSQVLPGSGMHSRSSLLDDATDNPFADSDTFPLQSKHRTQGSLGTSKSARESTLQAACENARSIVDFSYVDEDVDPNLKSISTSRPTKNVEVQNRRPQTPVSLILPKKDLGGSYTSLEEARFLESWDLGEDLNLPSIASGQSGSITSKWVYINKILCDNGFSPLDNSCTSLSPETFVKILDILSDVVRNFARREKLVQELLAERESLRQEEQQNDQLTVKLESDIDTLKRKLAASEQRAELATAASEKTFAALRKEHQRLEASHASMLQRCSQLEHVCRAKERSLRKHQEKIQEAVRREQSQRSRDKELYEKLKHKVALSQKAQGEIIESNFLLRDLKPACIVGIYERQRAANEAEMNHLREENSRLCKELREKENSVLSKAMSAVEADQEELDQREQDLIQQLTEVLETPQIDKQLTKKVSHCRQLEFREDSALLPLAVNQKDDLKKENISHHLPLKSDSAENKSSMMLLQRLQLDAAQERRNHQLLQEISKKHLEYTTSSLMCHTSTVSGCTSSKCQELMQDVCSKLKIIDPLRITDAIDSLLKVVAAVPRMESFIDNVCEVVFSEGYNFLTRENPESAEQTPEAIPDVLKFWLQELRSSAELQQFKDCVCTQLWERYDDKAEKQSMNCKLAAASVKDLINIERQYLLSQQSYREAQTLLKAEPQKLLHRIIRHFQMLFEIPQLEGVMAVMNSLYIQISEHHNFARVLCSMLGLPKDSGANTIISTVTGILNKVLLFLMASGLRKISGVQIAVFMIFICLSFGAPPAFIRVRL